MISKIYDFFVIKILGRVIFDSSRYLFTARTYNLNKEDLSTTWNFLKNTNMVILIWRKSHLTSYLISLAHFFLTGKFGKWSHACINAEWEDDDITKVDIIEAIGQGTKRSTFFEVFNCDGVCLLSPKLFNRQNWEQAIQEAKKHVEEKTPYDTWFNFKDDDKLSCIELVVDSMTKTTSANTFSHLKSMMKRYGKITPQMLRDCNDFNVIFEVRR